MTSQQPEQLSEPRVSQAPQPCNDAQGAETAGNREPSPDNSSHQATVLVRGETISDQAPSPPTKDPKDNDTHKDGKEKSPRQAVSEEKVALQSRLPALDDDADVGVQKEQLVVRDGKPDLAFTGALLASAAPPSAPKGHWEEYRVYETDGGKYVFSRVTRSVAAEDEDRHEADVFEPSPSSMPSQLLRSARDLARSRPLRWTDAAVSFFGYDPLAKVLYRKLGDQFDEHVN